MTQKRFAIKHPGAREYGLRELLGYAIASTAETALAAFCERHGLPASLLTATEVEVIEARP